MRFTVLSDNIGRGDLEGEWGLSFLIEYRNKKILLDAGASDLFLKNAALLGMSLEDIDFAVLSHAHYDHANGFVPLLERNRKISVYLQKSCRANCCKITEAGEEYIGIPAALTELYEDRLIRSEGCLLPAEGTHLIPHKKEGRSLIGLRERMFLREDGKLQPDDFSHEQSLVFETHRGLVIFSSCSHAGASDIIEEVSEALPGKSIYAMIGGFHLYNKTEEEVRIFSSRLRDADVRVICTGHCTGPEAYEILREELGGRITQFYSGMVITL